MDTTGAWIGARKSYTHVTGWACEIEVQIVREIVKEILTSVKHHLSQHLLFKKCLFSIEFLHTCELYIIYLKEHFYSHTHSYLSVDIIWVWYGSRKSYPHVIGWACEIYVQIVMDIVKELLTKAKYHLSQRLVFKKCLFENGSILFVHTCKIYIIYLKEHF